MKVLVKIFKHALILFMCLLGFATAQKVELVIDDYLEEAQISHLANNFEDEIVYLEMALEAQPTRIQELNIREKLQSLYSSQKMPQDYEENKIIIESLKAGHSQSSAEEKEEEIDHWQWSVSLGHYLMLYKDKSRNIYNTQWIEKGKVFNPREVENKDWSIGDRLINLTSNYSWGSDWAQNLSLDLNFLLGASYYQMLSNKDSVDATAIHEETGTLSYSLEKGPWYAEFALNLGPKSTIPNDTLLAWNRGGYYDLNYTIQMNEGTKLILSQGAQYSTNFFQNINSNLRYFTANSNWISTLDMGYKFVKNEDDAYSVVKLNIDNRPIISAGMDRALIDGQVNVGTDLATFLESAMSNIANLDSRQINEHRMAATYGLTWKGFKNLRIKNTWGAIYSIATSPEWVSVLSGQGRATILSAEINNKREYFALFTNSQSQSTLDHLKEDRRIQWTSYRYSPRITWLITNELTCEIFASYTFTNYLHDSNIYLHDNGHQFDFTQKIRWDF